MLVSQRIPNLLGGVSQRPAPERPLNALASSTNLLAHPVKGLMTRPGTQHRAQISTPLDVFDNGQFFTVSRSDAGQRLLVIPGDGSARVFDEATGESSLVFGDLGLVPGEFEDFLQSTAGFSAVSVGASTFLANRSRTVASRASTHAAALVEAHFWVKAAEADTFYSITVSGTTVTHTTAASGDFSPTAVAEALKLAIDTALGADWYVARYGSCVVVGRFDQATFTVEAADSLSNEGVKAINGFVDSLEDLPDKTKPASVLRVRGAVGSDKDDLWVMYDAPFVATQEKAWTEVSERAALELDEATLPWHMRESAVLVPHFVCPDPGGLTIPLPTVVVAGALVGRYLNDATTGAVGVITANTTTTVTVAAMVGGSFAVVIGGDRVSVTETPGDYTLGPARSPNLPRWSLRLAGDDANCPLPSFVGKQIREVFFYKNRLGFLADETVNLSASGDLFRFWRRTMTELLADDPIDVTSAFPGVAPFDGSVEWNNRLVLYSNAGHLFALSGEPALTPATVGLDHLMAIGAAKDVRPVVFGSRLVVPQQDSGYTRLTEVFYDDEDDGVLDHSDLSAEVPSYAVGAPKALVGSSDLGFLAVATTEEACTLYVFQERWAGQERSMAAWGQWVLGTEVDRVLSMHLQDSILTLLMKRGDSVFLETLDMGAAHEADAPTADRQGHAGSDAFTGECVVNPMYLRDRNGQPDVTGRLQLRYVTLGYSGTAGFGVTVTRAGLGTKQHTVVASPLTSGTKRLPVLGRNTENSLRITSNGATGFALTGLEWEGYFTKRNQSA